MKTTVKKIIELYIKLRERGIGGFELSMQNKIKNIFMIHYLFKHD